MMSDVRADRSRSERLVGRDAELAALVRLADDPATRLVLVGGDAGVGKTRLLTEARSRLADSGWRCLVGHCLDLGEGAMPYLPFAEIARGIADPPSAGAALERHEVLGSVHASLDALAAESPVLVVVEDAHWADASTRDLLSYLLTRPFAGRVLLVVTYRSDELHRRHPLRAQVAEWVRRPGVERLPLEPLAVGDVRRMVAELLGGPPAADAVDRIAHRAQGNAFYVEELVAAYAGGEELPDDLAELLLVRLERLDERTRALVRVAAVAGQRVPHDLLAAVAGLGEAELEASLREALDARVLVRVEDDDYAFRHALLGEAVYDDLLPGERTRLHTAYAAAVTALRGSRGAPELARHALASHDLPTALRASVAAADLAQAAGGPEEAAQHLRLALDLHPQVASQMEDPPADEDLVLRAVEALVAAGRPERAVGLAQQRVEALPAEADPQRRGVLLLAYLEAMRASEAVAHPVEHSEEALRLLGTEPSPLRARALAAHALALIWEDRHAEVLPFAEEALTQAERLDLPRVASDAGLALAWVRQRVGGGAAVVEEVQRLADRARAARDLLGEMRAECRIGFTLSEAGDLETAQRHFERAVAVGVEAGSPWSTHAVIGRTVAGVMAYQRGRLDEALQLVDHAREDPPPVPRALLDSVALAVAGTRGDLDALALRGPIRQRWREDGLTGAWSAHGTIPLLARRDGAAAAVAEYDEVLGVYSALWGDHFDALVRIAALTLGALSAAAAHTPSEARHGLRETGDRLVADVDRVREGWETDAWTPGIEARAWVARVGAERLRLDWLLGEPVDLAELEHAWREDAALFGELGWLEEEARGRARLGAVLRAAGQADEARAEVRAAREVAVRLGAVPLLEEVGERSPSADLLTPREHEILALVAEGRGNAEIGARLFISAKTVSVHVSNLMAKLGAASRTEAVALARRAGLLGD